MRLSLYITVVRTDKIFVLIITFRAKTGIPRDRILSQSLTLMIVSLSYNVLLEFSPTVKAATLIFISGCGSAISSAKEGKSGFIYKVKS